MDRAVSLYQCPHYNKSRRHQYCQVDTDLCARPELEWNPSEPPRPTQTGPDRPQPAKWLRRRRQRTMQSRAQKHERPKSRCKQTTRIVAPISRFLRSGRRRMEFIMTACLHAQAGRRYSQPDPQNALCGRRGQHCLPSALVVPTGCYPISSRSPTWPLTHVWRGCCDVVCTLLADSASETIGWYATGLRSAELVE